MSTIRQRLLPALPLVVCCVVVAVLVGRAPAETKQQDKPEDWEAQMTEVKMMSIHLEMYGQLVELIQGMHDIAQTPAGGATVAVMSLDDHLAPDKKIEFLNEMLREVDEPAVKRVIRIQLIEAYKNAGDHDAAMEHVEALITGEDG